MRPRELKRLLDHRPFEPIRLRISNGEHVDIRHPDMAIVSQSLVAVGVAAKEGIADHIAHYNLLHIVKIEPLNGNSTVKRGRRRKTT